MSRMCLASFDSLNSLDSFDTPTPSLPSFRPPSSARPPHIHLSMTACSTTVTEELEIILCTDVGPGDTLKVEAAAGAGKSTALRLFAEKHRDLRTLYLTFTAAEAAEKMEDYTRRGLDHVSVSTIHSCAFAATFPLHQGIAIDGLGLSASVVARLTRTSSMEWPSARLAALERVVQRFISSDALELSSVHLDAGVSSTGLLAAARLVWQAAQDGSLPLSHDMYLKICCLSPEYRAAIFRDVDLVLLDEAHDCTEAQISLVEEPSGRHWGSILVMDFRHRGGGGLKKAPLAAWEAVTRRAQLGSRGIRPRASWGGVERVFGGRSGACRFAHKKL